MNGLEPSTFCMARTRGATCQWVTADDKPHRCALPLPPPTDPERQQATPKAD